MEEEILDPEREDEESSDTEAKSGISADLIRGHINTIILRTLYERDKYGYEIIEEIESKSHGQYSLKQPTLYSALKRLENQGYINAYWKTDEVSQGGRRKYYTLTDSGREVTERNQAEWEYSRTVIDNLISDRNFDFTQPPPAPVDFKILKNSTSRIRTVRDDEESDEGRIVTYEEPPQEQVVEIEHEDATSVVITETVAEPAPEEVESVEPIIESPQEVVIQPEPQPVQAVQQEQPVQPEPQPVQPVEQPVIEPAVEEPPAMTEEERKILHENYLRLISQPVEEKKEVAETPYAESMDTDKIIYNNRPEAERDYRNLINKLFINTVRETPVPPAPAPEPEPAPQPQYQPQPEPVIVEKPKPQYETQYIVDTVRIDEATAKAKNDGLSVGTSEYSVGTRRRKYNRGSAMFKCALIVGVIMLLEFALCVIFKKDLGISLAYPFVIFALACAEVLIFGVLCYTDVGKSSRRPTVKIYIPACIVVAVIAILIIFVASLLLNINFTLVGDILSKIVIPCIVVLNIPIFGLLLYLFSK